VTGNLLNPKKPFLVKFMENIGYLHLASHYETPDETLANLDSATVGVDSIASTLKNWKNLSSYAVMRFLPVFLSLSVVNLVGQTLTAQKAAAAISVTTTQQCLKRLGYFRGPVTGNYGPLTQSAVTRFQKANRLPAIGTVGPKTEQLLRSQCNRTGGGSNNSGDLRLGSSGAAVSNLQRNLQRLGYYNGPVNGNFGQLTQAAVIRFQRAKGINPDGVVGSRTLNAIRGVAVNPVPPYNPAPPYTGEGGTYDTYPNALNEGDRGPAVTQLQQDLQQLGFFQTTPIGIFGPATRTAVSNFQSREGFIPNGIADSQTLARISQLLNRTPTNTTGCSVERRDICEGERSDRVILVQQRLQQWNFFTGNADGYYGPGTRDAVAQFQRYLRLNPTGFVDAATWQALQITNDTSGYPPVTPPVVGKTNNRYVVVIPVTGNDTLNRVRQILPQAVQATSGRGDYVNAGAFSERSDAERLTRQLRDRGFDARVQFF
jgi:peptidoglycan hydrolase-like protein with peptidoglycan-binding domain